jgi:tetratricopeptide (TPR) repeat protein
LRGTIQIAVLALGVVLLVGAASAQPRDVTRADALFREGRALMKKGDYATACPKLEESYRLDPAAGTGINLGDCFEKQGKVASALLAYQAARALLQPGDPRIGPVEKEISALDKRAPRLTIKLAAGVPDGTTVKRDGREVEAAKLGVPVAVNPGKYKIVVSAPGRESARYGVTVADGDERVVLGEVGGRDNETKKNSERVPSAARDNGGENLPDDGSSQRTLGYLAGGAGLASALVGSYFLIKFNKGSAENDQPDYNQAAVTNDGHLAAGFLIGGALGVLGGVALVLTAPTPSAVHRRGGLESAALGGGCRFGGVF